MKVPLKDSVVKFEYPGQQPDGKMSLDPARRLLKDLPPETKALFKRLRESGEMELLGC